MILDTPQTKPENGLSPGGIPQNVNGHNFRPQVQMQPVPSNNQSNDSTSHAMAPPAQQNRGVPVQNTAVPMKRPLENKSQLQNPTPHAQKSHSAPQAAQIVAGQPGGPKFSPAQQGQPPANNPLNNPLNNPTGPQRQLPSNNTSLNNPPRPQRQPVHNNTSTSNHPGAQDVVPNPAPEAPVGFYTARVAETVQVGAAPSARAASFNPRLESPSIRKTDGFDHSNSKPVTRDALGPPKVGPPPNNCAIGGPRANYVNPQWDPTRRIGAPGGMPSPLQNRGSYKPPLMKRPAEDSAGPQ